MASAPEPDRLGPRHRIYTGTIAALERRWLGSVAELQRRDPLAEVNVLVGSNILATYLKRRMADERGAAANVRFHTFPDLVRRLIGEGAAPAVPRLPRHGRRILVGKILQEPLPPVFAPMAGYRGFRDALLETFRDLGDAGIDPRDLVRAAGTRRGASPGARQLGGLAELYRRFRERAGRFHDEGDDFGSALHRVSRGGAAGLSRLLIYGVYDVTGRQARLLEALKDPVALTFFVPFVDMTVSAFAHPFLQDRIRELGVEPVAVTAPPSAGGLGLLAARNFGFLPETGARDPIPADGSFALVSVPGESRAAVEIVREILRAATDGTISGFHEAAVILRQPESDGPALIEAFRLREIPCFVHGGVRFADRPLARAVVALCALAEGGFARDAILGTMEQIEAARADPERSAWDVQSWRGLTRDPSFLGGARSWDAGVRAIADRTESAAQLRDAWLVLRRAVADWPASLPWREWGLFLEQRFGPVLGAANDWSFLETVFGEIAGLEVLGRTEPGGEGRAGREELRAVLKEALGSLTCPAGRFQQSGVHLLPASAARGLRFPLVIVPGLDEGRFPARLRQDPLLPDSDRRRLKPLPIKSMRYDEEKLLFDMAARSAEKRLVLLASRLDESADRERIPSQFFLRAAAAVRGEAVSMRDLNPGAIAGFRSVSLDSTAPGPGEIAVDAGEIRLRLITSDRGFERQALEALAHLEPLRLRRPLAFDRARRQPSLTGFDGRITDPDLVGHAARKIGADSGPVSPSRIEEYARCPYYFFLKRIMELEAWEEPLPAEGMDPLERGTAVHAILEAFLKSCLGGTFSPASRETMGRRLEEEALRVLENARPAGLPGLLWEIERDALVGVLSRWLDFETERGGEGSLRVARLEQSFGQFPGQDPLPPCLIKAGGREFRFRGRIDRVDLSPDGKRARVIDYKTGTMPATLARASRPPLMGGERLQLAVYREALSVLPGFEAVETVDGEYLFLQPRDGRVVSANFADEELKGAVRALPHALEILGEGIDNGVFFPKTSGTLYPDGHCEYCDYVTICGKDRVSREARKASDPAVARFRRILELPR